MKTLGIILARAGSKGLPDKCVRPLLGRPLIDYTIDHANAAHRLHALVLTTDSRRATEIAMARGVEVVERPPELATDTAAVEAAARHAVETWERRHGERVDALVILYANVPVRAPGAIDAALEKLAATGASSVRSVAPVGRHHPDWMHRLEGDRMVQFRPNSRDRRQDLEPLFYHDGAVIAVTRAALLAAATQPDDRQAFLGPDRRAILLRPEDTVDVDDALDLALAEAVLRAGGASRAPREARVCIGAREIARGGPVYVIAEAGVNHDGSRDRALELVLAAHQAGADAVKFQVFRTEDLAVPTAPLAAYQAPCGAIDQRAMLRRLELSDADLRAIQARCRQCGIDMIATPFGVRDVQRLAALDLPAIKIGSADIDHLALLRAAAETGRPVLLSTGAASGDEIRAAVRALRDAGAGERLALLHCVSAYPTPWERANLGAIRTLAAEFALPCGFSDHTTSVQTGALAVAAGASLLEKHVTLDRNALGPDHAMSLGPVELRDYVALARRAEAALGTGDLGLSAIEHDVRRVARRSLVAARDLSAGALLTPNDLAARRPAGGISPSLLDDLIGRQLRVDVPGNAPLDWSMLR
jgi:N,N'-diacetyllegionaminate synthase